MIKNKKVLAIVPARGGSKRLPKKNIRPLLNKPLIGWTIESAKQSKYIDKVIVSTDDKKIAEIAKEYGAKVPFLRSKELAKDDSSTDEVVLHTIKWFENHGEYYDIIVLLQPTSPLRGEKDIDNSLEIFVKNNNALSLISVKERDHPIFWDFIMKDNYLVPLYKDLCKKRSQDLPKTYVPNGAIYITYVEIFKRYKSFITKKIIPYVMPPEKSVDIDTEFDFKFAEFILKEYYKNK